MKVGFREYETPKVSQNVSVDVGVNPVPVMVTTVPRGPLIGVKPVIVAAHVKVLAEVTGLLGVLTKI